jgi:hypothetical protein
MRWLAAKSVGRALALAAVVALWAGPAEAQRAKRRPRAASGQQHGCRGAMNTAELQEQTNHLIDAARLFAGCARKSCGAFVYKHCKQQQARVSRAVPSVILSASEPVGAGPLDVQVTVDGGAISPPPPGQALRLDPGTHEFTFKSADGRTTSEKVMVARGQRHRSIAVVLPGAGKGGPARAADPLAGLDLGKPLAPPPTTPAPPAATVQEAPPPPAVAQVVDHEEPPPRPSSADSPRQSRSVGPYLLAGLGLLV